MLFPINQKNRAYKYLLEQQFAIVWFYEKVNELFYLDI